MAKDLRRAVATLTDLMDPAASEQRVAQHHAGNMVFAEQRMLPMCAKKLNMSIMSFSDLNRLFKSGDNMFTHTWGMKQQMRDNAFLRADFCRRCIKRIIKDFPEMKNIIMNIENLKQYF